MADKIIDFKKATDSNLIKLWVEHYKEQGEKKLLTNRKHKNFTTKATQEA